MLLTTLIIIFLLALLGMHSFRTEISHYQSYSQALLQRSAYFETKQALNEVQKNLLVASKTCLIRRQSVKTLANLPDTFWNKCLCQGDKKLIHYSYVVEMLEIDDCGIIKSQGEELQKAKYYRITIVSLIKGMKGVSIMLQRTVALKAGPSVFCKNNLHYLREGAQMQRQIMRFQ